MTFFGNVIEKINKEMNLFYEATVLIAAEEDFLSLILPILFVLKMSSAFMSAAYI